MKPCAATTYNTLGHNSNASLTESIMQSAPGTNSSHQYFRCLRCGIHGSQSLFFPLNVDNCFGDVVSLKKSAEYAGTVHNRLQEDVLPRIWWKDECILLRSCAVLKPWRFTRCHVNATFFSNVDREEEASSHNVGIYFQKLRMVTIYPTCPEWLKRQDKLRILNGENQQSEPQCSSFVGVLTEKLSLENPMLNLCWFFLFNIGKTQYFRAT